MNLVVGATGILGSEICRRLAARDQPVRALVRHTSDSAKVAALDEMGATLAYGDLKVDPDYQSEQPIHPDRAFTGIEQVRKNWSAMFSSLPDFRAELLRATTAGDTSWAEWHWSGTYADGTRMEMMGVTIFGIRDNRIVWGRLYMEPVEQTGAGIDTAIENWTHKNT